jgi:hypothetical protein
MRGQKTERSENDHFSPHGEKSLSIHLSEARKSEKKKKGKKIMQPLNDYFSRSLHQF